MLPPLPAEEQVDRVFVDVDGEGEVMHCPGSQVRSRWLAGWPPAWLAKKGLGGEGGDWSNGCLLSKWGWCFAYGAALRCAPIT